MYEPNSVRGLLNKSKGDQIEQEANASDLISEMDAFIANLQTWREQRRQLDAEIRSASKPAAVDSAPDQPLEDEPDIKPMEVDFAALTAVESPPIDIQSLMKDPEQEKFEVSLPKEDFKSSDLYEIGQRLKEKLEVPEDLELISGKADEVQHSGGAWDTVDEIEKELEDLERELEAVNIHSPNY